MAIIILFSVLVEKKSAFHNFHVFLCGAKITRCVVTLEKCREYAFLGGYAQIIKMGGVFQDPKFVLRNKWTAPEIADDHM